MLLTAFLLVLLYGLCAAAESAYMAANPLRLEVATPRTGLSGRAIRHLLASPGRLLETSLLGRITVIVLLASIAVGAGMPRAYGALLDGAGLSEGLSFFLSASLVTLALVLFVLVFGELLPRSMALRHPEDAARVVAIPVRIIYLALLPFIGLLHLVALGIQRWTGRSDAPVGSSLAEYFERRRRYGKSLSAISTRDRGEVLFENVIMMASVRVKDSMVPRTDIEGVEETASIREVRKQFVESGYSKLPVFRENMDRIVGVVFAHDLFSDPTSLSSIVRPARFVPESKPSKYLLREFLATNSSIAIVIDEYGGTAGLVTREDLLEELFGDIQDEFDSDDDILERQADGSVLASGRVELTTLAERFGIELDEGDYESLAGYLLEQLGAIPPNGHECQIKGITFRIARSTRNRIELVRIIPPHGLAGLTSQS